MASPSDTMPNTTDEDGDTRAAAMAIEASRTSGGAPTAAIAGNTVAVVMNTDNLVQALPPLPNTPDSQLNKNYSGPQDM